MCTNYTTLVAQSLTKIYKAEIRENLSMHEPNLVSKGRISKPLGEPGHSCSLQNKDEISKDLNTDKSSQHANSNAPSTDIKSVKKSLGQRAKVTVQRQANVGKKVVSLSFDQAVKLGSTKSGNTTKSTSSKSSKVISNKWNQANTVNLGCSISMAQSPVVSQTNTAHRESCEKTDLTVNDMTLEESKVKPLSIRNYEEGETNSTSEPVPAPRRLAWMSPKIMAKQKSDSQEVTVKRTTTTNTREHKLIPEAPGEGVHQLAVRDACDSKQSVNENVENHSNPTSIKSPPLLKQKHSPDRSSVEDDLSNTGKNPESDSTKILQKEVTPHALKMNATKLIQSDICKEEPTDTVIQPTDADSHGELTMSRNKDHDSIHSKGISELVLQDMGQSSLTGAAESKGEESENVEKKGIHSKKKSSFFSWSPFKKKNHKKFDKKSGKPSTDTACIDGDVEKQSMAKDILCNQGKVAIPTHLTEMFLAKRAVGLGSGDNAKV